MRYRPAPIDTAAVELDRAQRLLVEKLARNTHDVWAQQRLDDGWRYGAERNDTAKTHPCLVPYDQLPEDEKDYDRVVSGAVVKTLLKMGYTIQSPQIRDAASEAEEAWLHLRSLATCPAELLAFWQQRDEDVWAHRPELYLWIGRQFLKMADALTAYDALSVGLKRVSDVTLLDRDDPLRELHLELRQQRALALIHTGAYQQAREDLVLLAEQIGYDGEICGLIGRTWKEQASHCLDEIPRQQALKAAFSCYEQGWQLALAADQVDQAYYAGINAATLALWGGDLQGAHHLAGQVYPLCDRERQRLEHADETVPFWLLATLGEAALLLEQDDQAEHWYAAAVERMGADLRAKASMYAQARRIVDSLGSASPWLETLLAPPSVVVFCGHRVDLADAQSPRFPAAAEQRVREQISTRLEALDAGIGYGAAASGADLLFHEEMLRRGGKVVVVLPFEIEPFRRISVEEAGVEWGCRFDAVIGRADEVRVLGRYDQRAANGLFDFCNHYMYGAARIHSASLNSAFHALCVWNGGGGAPGGTASAVALWRRMSPVWQINPLQEESRLLPLFQEPIPAEIHFADKGSGEVRHHSHLYMLFADVKGYSQLSESQSAIFSECFLEHVGRVIGRFDRGILSRRTQGDGLFLVFDSLPTALALAKELRDETAAVDWTRHQLPDSLTYRISLDAGPCFSYRDPITGQQEYCGHYVVRAARMEPVTPPGQVFASETFVAMARMQGIAAATFSYAGQIALPKNYGCVQAFHVA